MRKKLHLGIGHYGIGFQDGVNTVISRNVRALLDIDPDLKITLFGKLSPDYEEFLPPVPDRLEYLNIEEFSPEAAFRRRVEKPIADQQVHDYVWQGTNLAEILDRTLSDIEIVLIENLGVGIDPSVTYAFYLYTHYCDESGSKKRFIYRVHDFVQQRPRFFRNVKKFHEYRFGVVPDWHSVLYPSTPNIRYIAINRYDRSRLIEHGIEEDSISYIPNSIDRSIIPLDDRTEELRSKVVKREGIDPAVRFILYPVRCVRRKNVEEAIFFTHYLNHLASRNSVRNSTQIVGKFHLIVSLIPEGGDDAQYAEQIREFVKEHKLPVSIGFNDLVALEREMDPTDRLKVEKYGVGDMLRLADLVITTSVLEGFGFAYLEPWILDKPVIGRSIPLITPDFQAKGMNLGHLYSVLIVDEQDYKDLGSEKATDEKALEARLDKILELDDTAFFNRMLARNGTTTRATARLANREKAEKVIANNRRVVESAFSQEVIGRQIHDVIASR